MNCLKKSVMIFAMIETTRKKTKIVVAMSGGVDSTVAASLLKDQGYDVIGMFMKNWDETDENGICQASKDWDDVVAVCDKIGIPCYSVSFAKEYWDNVFKHTIDEFKKGNTPNPDVLCNREIKFKVLLDKAKELGGEYLATGHYCRRKKDGDEWQLLKGIDRNKDQSYFLYMIKSDILKNVLFPIGEMEKPSIRSMAKDLKLPTAEKKDSTGICFIGERNFKNFLSQYIDFKPGNFENSQGEVIDQHDGVPFYTIGQRKGLNIGGPGDAWYVVGKDIARNVVIVEQGADHPALFASGLKANQLTWISEKNRPKTPFSCTAKIRYRQNDTACVIENIKEDTANVRFLEPQRAVTPSQSIVFYDQDICLGGGVIL